MGGWSSFFTGLGLCPTVASAKEEKSDPEENGLWARGPHRLACPLLG